MFNARKYLIAAAVTLTLGFFSTVQADGVKVIIENRAPTNGTWLTPFWVGFHDGTFDVYNQMTEASAELENLAEDGNTEPLMNLFDLSGTGNVQGVIQTGDTLPPFAPGETAEMTFILDGTDPANRYFSYATMVIPSNDAFIGNDDPTAHQIYDASGNFLGAYFTIYGSAVKDAGTEVNDEIPENTAFFGQMVPNTGVDENGVVHDHPGYLPVGSGGILDDPMFANADFTEPGYEVARITIIRSDTPVSGNVSGLWDLNGSPYLLDGEVTVPAGETLTIEPGVVVFSNSWHGLHVQGTLQAIGTETDSILFTTTPVGFPPSNPGWKGIRFENSDDGSEIAYCIVENAKVTAGGAEARGAGIYSLNSSPVIRNSTLRDGWAGAEGGSIYIEGGSPVVIDNDIIDNRIAWPSSGYGGGIAAEGSDPEITGNTISNNEVQASGTYPSGIAIARGGGIYLNNCGGIVSGNVITNNVADASPTSISSESSGGGIQVWESTTEIRNNTVSGNSALGAGGYGGGVHIYGLYANTLTLVNNIIEGNTGGGIYFDDFTANAEVYYNDFYNNGDAFLGQVPTGLGHIVTTNNNGDPSDMYYNIFLDPLFVDATSGDYSLQATSPAIDAGDPTTPSDPDGTIADLGAFYYDQGGIPLVDITLTPYNPPIVIPANGGSFSFNVAIANNEAESVNLDAWIMVQLPNGSWYGPLLGPVNLTLASGANLNRDRSQTIPSGAPTGTYLYEGYVGVYPNTVWDSNSFTFEKSTAGDGSVISQWKNDGEGFEELSAEPALNIPSEFALMGAYPNPFNPVTTISFALPEAARISLNVFDVSGRLVATLVDGYRDAGAHEVTFDASDLASGVYIYRLQASNVSAVGKMMLVK